VTMGLTRLQLDLLGFIESYFAEHKIAPSFDEMRDFAGLSSKEGVFRLVNALEERGFIRRLRKRARAIELVHKDGVVVCFHCGNPAGSKACRAAADLDRALRNSSLQDAGQTVRPSAATGVRT